MNAPDFWTHAEAAQKVVAELKGVNSVVESYLGASAQVADELGLAEMCDDAKDRAHLEEISAKLPALRKAVEQIELQTLFNRPNDPRDVFLSIHAGEGGTDSMDFAAMLLRMYQRWLDQNGYQSALVDYQAGDEAGIKRAVLDVRGKYPFGYLKGEVGGHRLIRLSPFDANHKRQTSYVAVDVTPQYDDVEVDINEKDLKIDTYSAGGPGGQHVNKTQSAVRITHLPSGIIVQCQNERSQQLNRKVAMRSLASKLHQLEETKRDGELAKLYGEKGEIGYGNKIRSYTLHPYTLVKDHRTDVETGNVQAVLDGAIDPFLEAFLRWKDRKY